MARANPGESLLPAPGQPPTRRADPKVTTVIEVEAGNEVATQPIRLFEEPAPLCLITSQSAAVHAHPQGLLRPSCEAPHLYQSNAIQFPHPGHSARFISAHATASADPHFIARPGQQRRNRPRHILQARRGPEAVLIPNEQTAAPGPDQQLTFPRFGNRPDIRIHQPLRLGVTRPIPAVPTVDARAFGPSPERAILPGSDGHDRAATPSVRRIHRLETGCVEGIQPPVSQSRPDRALVVLA